MIVTSQQERLALFFCEMNKIEYHKDTRSIYIGLESSSGEIDAVIEYNNFIGDSIQIHSAIKRLNREFLWFLFHYPFIQLGVKKLIGCVPTTNEKALKLNYHIGFTHEHTIKDAGNNCDLVILSMTKEQCRFLR